MKNTHNKKHAFTLTEIIISLSILGIIVVIMMQVLHPNINEVEAKAKLNAAHAIISRAIIQYQAETLCAGNLASCDDFIYDNVDLDKLYDNIFANKFKLEQHCGTLIGLGCFSRENYKYKNGMLFPNPDNDADYYKVRLQNGISIAFTVTKPKCYNNICMRIIVDTNGPMGPNIVNRDVYTGVVTTNLVKFETEE